jgi:hypothetical protein
MFRIKQITAAVLIGVSATASWASEVYIEQVGSSTTINITQTGSTNMVNGAQGTTDAALVSGSSIGLDITQIGDNNEAVVNLNTATSADVEYNATGSGNLFDVYVDGGSSNTLTANVTGDSNRLTVCGANDGTASAVSPGTTGPACSSGITANNVTNTIGIIGDLNVVNVAVASLAGTTNTIDIGGTTVSNSNIVNVTQTNTDVNIVNLSVDGSTNVINILQD